MLTEIQSIGPHKSRLQNASKKYTVSVKAATDSHKEGFLGQLVRQDGPSVRGQQGQGKETGFCRGATH